MKHKILQIAFLLILQIVYSQNHITSKTNQFEFKTSFSIGFIYPIEFGSTALAEGHSSNLGLTSSLGILKYSNFSAGIGLDYLSYSVENKQLIGNYESSKHNSYFFYLNYDYPIYKKFSLTPTIGYGYSELVIKKSGKRRGAQDGKEFRLGTSINYNFNQHNALCFSILYVNNRYDVKTEEALEDFFGKSNSIQIGIIYKTK